MAVQTTEISKDFNFENFEFRLKAPRPLVKKVLTKMKKMSIRKRSEIMYTLLDAWVNTDEDKKKTGS